MRKPEQRLWDAMRTSASRPPGIALDRIENGVGVGWPDVSLRKLNHQTWIELKACTAPKRMSSKMLGKKGLRPDQVNWHLRHASFGLLSYVLVRDNLGCLYLLPGRLAEDINDMSRLEMQKASIASTWPEIWKEIAP